MLCCWKKNTEKKTLTKPLLAESKSVTGEPKIVTERRSPSVPIQIKTFPPPPPKLESAYSSLPPLPAPIYIKSELSSVKPEPTLEVIPIPAPLPAPLPVPIPAPLPAPGPAPVPAPIPAPVPAEDNPVEIKSEQAPIEAKPIQKKNLKSNKRI
jgi:hypothetical protein